MGNDMRCVVSLPRPTQILRMLKQNICRRPREDIHAPDSRRCLRTICRRLQGVWVISLCVNDDPELLPPCRAASDPGTWAGDRGLFIMDATRGLAVTGRGSDRQVRPTVRLRSDR
jgi:hypothetical protein